MRGTRSNATVDATLTILFTPETMKVIGIGGRFGTSLISAYLTKVRVLRFLEMLMYR